MVRSCSNLSVNSHNHPQILCVGYRYNPAWQNLKSLILGLIKHIKPKYVMAGRHVFLRSCFIFYFSVFAFFCIPFVCYFNYGYDFGVYPARIMLQRTRFRQSRLSYYSNSVSSFNLPAQQILRNNDACPQPGPSCNGSILYFIKTSKA